MIMRCGSPANLGMSPIGVMNRFCQVNPLVVRREAAHGQWMESAAHCRGRVASSTI